jgi:hypothetical protein
VQAAAPMTGDDGRPAQRVCVRPQPPKSTRSTARSPGGAGSVCCERAGATDASADASQRGYTSHRNDAR